MRRLLAAGCVLALAGCTSPVVRLTTLEDGETKGVRVRQYVPYEVLVYAVDDAGALVLKQTAVENLPHPTNVYALNYWGAFVSSSKFSVGFTENGALSGVRVETLRTLKDAAAAAQSVNEQVLKLRQAQKDAKTEQAQRKGVVDQLKAIKDYREAYKAAVGAPSAPGEPALPDGSSLPSNP